MVSCLTTVTLAVLVKRYVVVKVVEVGRLLWALLLRSLLALLLWCGLPLHLSLWLVKALLLCATLSIGLTIVRLVAP